MTFRNKGLGYIKFSLALFLLLGFVVVIAYADKFKKGAEVLYVNTDAFVQAKDDASCAISLDNINVEYLEGNEQGVITYIVQDGDTLSKIASKFGTTISHIKKINGISGPIRPNQKLVITPEENGLLYTIPEKINVLVFANKYSLDLEDLMTLNYIQDESEMLQQDQEVFLPVTLEIAYNVGLMERPKPVYVPKTKVVTPTVIKPVKNFNSSYSSVYAGSSVLSSWVFKKNINNKFYKGHCTWYVAVTTPSIFPYTDENTQSRPFGGNGNQRYDNAKSAGFSVGKTPVAGAIIVYNRGGGKFASAGHVAKVISYDSAAGKLVIEEMNGSNKFVVQRRTDRVDNPNIKGYIYVPAN